MEKKELIPYDEQLPAESAREKIEIYIPESKKRQESWISLFLKYWRFASITAAFAAIFFLILLIGGGVSVNKAPASSTGREETTSPIDIDAAAPPQKELPLFIDESQSGINIGDCTDYAYSLSHLKKQKILIVHSHSSERVSASLTVGDAGRVIADLLESAGLTVIHHTEEFDRESSIGAYERMCTSVKEQIENDPSIALVIDLHDSDVGLPFTLTVGSSEDYGWRENLSLACALYVNTEEIEGAVRLLPHDIGQNSGVLTLNIGIGSSDTDEDTARKLISGISLSIISLYNKNAVEVSNSIFIYINQRT